MAVVGNLTLYFLVGIIVLRCTNGEFYTSSSKLPQLLKIENNFLEKINNYLIVDTKRIDNLKRHLEEIKAVKYSLESPTDSFMFLNRLKKWKIILEEDKKAENSQLKGLRNHVVRQIKNLTDIPSKEVDGAGRALLRLQEVYALTTKDIIKGNIGPSKSSRELNRLEIFDIGATAYLDKIWYFAVSWLETALRKFQEILPDCRGGCFQKYLEVLQCLNYAYFAVGELSKSLEMAKEYLRKGGESSDLLQKRMKYIESKLKDDEKMEDPFFEDSKKHPDSVFSWYEPYIKLCRGQSNVTKEEKARLKCFYDSKNKMYQYSPPKIEEFSQSPLIIVYHDIIGKSEAEEIKNIAINTIERSEVVQSGTGISYEAKYRVSSGSFFWDPDFPVLKKMNRRVEYLTGLFCTMEDDHMTAEGFQVVNYGLGGHYEPHLDYAKPRKTENGIEFIEDMHLFGSRNRLATFMYYLSDVQAGGYTVFPFLDLFIPPIKNGAVFWYNIKHSGELDNRTLHAGCPVLVGNKWVANKWIHEAGQEFVHKCELEI